MSPTPSSARSDMRSARSVPFVTSVGFDAKFPRTSEQCLAVRPALRQQRLIPLQTDNAHAGLQIQLLKKVRVVPLDELNVCGVRLPAHPDETEGTVQIAAIWRGYDESGADLMRRQIFSLGQCKKNGHGASSVAER